MSQKSKKNFKTVPSKIEGLDLLGECCKLLLWSYMMCCYEGDMCKFMSWCVYKTTKY